MIPLLRRCARRKRNNSTFSVKPVQGSKDLKILYIRDSILISFCRGPWQTFFCCIRCNLSYTTQYSLPSSSQLENGAKQYCLLYSTNTSFLLRYYETCYDYTNFSLVLLSLKFGNSQTGTLRFAYLYTYNKTAGFLPMWSSINHLLLSNLLYDTYYYHKKRSRTTTRRQQPFGSCIFKSLPLCYNCNTFFKCITF